MQEAMRVADCCCRRSCPTVMPSYCHLLLACGGVAQQQALLTQKNKMRSGPTKRKSISSSIYNYAARYKSISSWLLIVNSTNSSARREKIRYLLFGAPTPGRCAANKFFGAGDSMKKLPKKAKVLCCHPQKRAR